MGPVGCAVTAPAFARAVGVTFAACAVKPPFTAGQQLAPKGGEPVDACFWDRFEHALALRQSGLRAYQLHGSGPGIGRHDGLQHHPVLRRLLGCAARHVGHEGLGWWWCRRVHFRRPCVRCCTARSIKDMTVRGSLPAPERSSMALTRGSRSTSRLVRSSMAWA